MYAILFWFDFSQPSSEILKPKFVNLCSGNPPYHHMQVAIFEGTLLGAFNICFSFLPIKKIKLKEHVENLLTEPLTGSSEHFRETDKSFFQGCCSLRFPAFLEMQNEIFLSFMENGSPWSNCFNICLQTKIPFYSF